MKAHTIKALTMVVGVAAASGLVAQTFTVSGTVSNAVAVTETTPLALGTIAVTGFDTTNASMTAGSLTIAAFDGAVTTSNGTAASDAAGAYASGAISKFTALGGQLAGALTIAGGAANGTVNIDISTPAYVNLTSGIPSTPTIILSALSTFPASTITLDGSGGGVVATGMTFTTEDSTNLYSDGVYTGSYDINFAY